MRSDRLVKVAPIGSANVAESSAADDRGMIDRAALERDTAADPDAALRVGQSLPIRIQTFGRFSIRRAGSPVYSNGKAQQRPLALLKAVAAKGGHDVSCSLLWECLWPDSDGDLGSRNLTITLHRLRHLLGDTAAVLCHDGKLSLNERLCWLDVWHFERLVNDGLHLPVQARSQDWETSLRAALRLYVGHFLALEAEESWMLEPRARWRIKFERAVTALASHLETEGRFDDGIDLCLQALELDPLNELLYRRLMNCYLKRGEISAVVRVYCECREALAKGLCSKPSDETDRLYRQAVGGDLRLERRPGMETLLSPTPNLQSVVRVSAR